MNQLERKEKGERWMRSTYTTGPADMRPLSQDRCRNRTVRGSTPVFSRQFALVPVRPSTSRHGLFVINFAAGKGVE